MGDNLMKKKYILNEDVKPNIRRKVIREDQENNSDIFLNANTYEQPLTPEQVQVRLSNALGARKTIENTLKLNLDPTVRSAQEQNLAIINSYIDELKNLKAAQDIKSAGNQETTNDKKPGGDGYDPKPEDKINQEKGEEKGKQKEGQEEEEEEKKEGQEETEEEEEKEEKKTDGGDDSDPNEIEAKLFGDNDPEKLKQLGKQGKLKIDIEKLQNELISKINELDGKEAKRGAITAIGDVLNGLGIADFDD